MRGAPPVWFRFCQYPGDEACEAAPFAEVAPRAFAERDQSVLLGKARFLWVAEAEEIRDVRRIQPAHRRCRSRMPPGLLFLVCRLATHQGNYSRKTIPHNIKKVH